MVLMVGGFSEGRGVQQAEKVLGAMAAPTYPEHVTHWEGLVPHRSSVDQSIFLLITVSPKRLESHDVEIGAHVHVGAKGLHHQTCVLESWLGGGRAGFQAREHHTGLLQFLGEEL